MKNKFVKTEQIIASVVLQNKIRQKHATTMSIYAVILMFSKQPKSLN